MAQNSAELWKSLTPAQRQAAMSRMTPEQKKNLAAALGFQGAAQSEAPSDSGGFLNKLPGPVKNFATGFLTTIPQMIAHPLQSGAGQGEAFTATGMAPGGMYPTTAATGRPEDQAGNRAIQQIAQQGQQGAAKNIAANPAQFAGGVASQIALGKLMGLGGILGAEPSIDPITPLERTVRKDIAPAFKPVNVDSSTKMVEIMREPGVLTDLAEFADRTNNPMKDALQVSRAATDAGRETTEYYRNNFIEPNEHASIGVGKETVGSAYKRVSEINDMLSPTYLKQGSKLSATIDSEKAMGLQAELNTLNNALYETLSERSGLPVETIQQINQRGARLQNLGKHMEVGYNTLERGEAGLDAVGNAIPHSPYRPIFQLAINGVNKLRGGPMGIAARGVQKAVRKFPEGYTPLPDPETIAAYRRNVEKSELGRIGSEKDAASANRAQQSVRLAAQKSAVQAAPEFLKPEVLNPDAALKTFMERQTQRQGAVASHAERLQNALRQQKLREQSQLAKARELQEQSRVAKDYGNQ